MCTPLHLACRNGFTAIADLLLQHKSVDLNLQNKVGETALSVCESDEIREKLQEKMKSGTPQQPTTISKFISLLKKELGDILTFTESTHEFPKEEQEIEMIILTIKERIEQLKKENRRLQSLLAEGEAFKKNLEAEAIQYKQTVSTMTSLISADMSKFTAKEILGTGSYGAAFKVQFCGNNASPQQMMVMKLQFNMEGISGQTQLRNKYMTECHNLALIPHHPNVIHPLGAFVTPKLPKEFLALIPPDKEVYIQWARDNKSFVFLMPYGGIHLSSYLCSLKPSEKVSITLDIFNQALKAVHHIETNSIVHRDIKQDNILVDPATRRLTLIDFGCAQDCITDGEGNLSYVISPTGDTWGNLGTIPPEVMSFANTGGRAKSFSYSKCDSFSLAVTFYDSLLPEPTPDHPKTKFIGSTLNGSMHEFTPEALFASFPLPQPFATTPPPTSSTTAATAPTNNHTDPKVQCLCDVLAAMMHNSQPHRMSASQALTTIAQTMV
ncbi:hypothetical protein Pelo_16322 [Pelomyxa schiedti]|nr:hypothetical protein Pelo_16322 [Pelomyxa schiedti]